MNQKIFIFQNLFCILIKLFKKIYLLELLSFCFLSAGGTDCFPLESNEIPNNCNDQKVLFLRVNSLVWFKYAL